MIEVYSKALSEELKIERIIGHLEGTKPGPTLIFMAGIHGNEPAGVFALKRVYDSITTSNISIKGNIFFIAGNLTALQKGIRFEDEDLNRLWTYDRMNDLSLSLDKARTAEMAEQIQINQLINEILQKHTGPFYFFDIHTTSSATLPFLTVNDSLINRAYTSQYPIPIILGIEEYLDGPILSYINELGYVAFGFEAGQHDDLASIENAEAFTYLSLVFAGTIQKDQISFQHYFDLLAKNSGDVKHVYEIFFRYSIAENERFKMESGFFNFQRIHKNQLIATSDGKSVKAKNNGRIFMPLYQDQGTDGFFAIRRIKKFFLKMSAIFRKYRLDRLLVLLPGISWLDQERSGLMVNHRVARFMAKDLFHLFGYRAVYYDRQHYKMFNREANARFEDYAGEPWQDQNASAMLR